MNRIIFATLLLIASISAQGDDLSVAGGGGAKNGSTYSAMLTDLTMVCSTDQLTLKEVNTSGGVENLELLRGNKVKSAIVPTSVLMAAKLSNPSSVARVRTLFTLHPEEVHVIARDGVKTEGGVTVFGKNFAGKTVVYNTIDDLKGRPVGAVGGSVVDARILNDLLRLGFVVQQFKDNDALITALNGGVIDAAVIVAGAPSAAVGKLPAGKFKLLTLRGNSETSSVYVPAKLEYSSMNGGRSVDTLATQALFVTRTFESEEMLSRLAILRACFKKQLPVLKDKDGTHPKWQDVVSTDQGKWEWYSLPSVEAPAFVTKK